MRDTDSSPPSTVVTREQAMLTAIRARLPNEVAEVGEDVLPLVSCIMPTYNRPGYVAQAIRYFQRQDYPRRELLILDDGTESSEHLIPSDPQIRYIRLDRRVVLGSKRNLGCRLAEGAVIAHWDDDDWIAPHRLSYQVGLLLSHKAELCGAIRQFYYDPANDKAWLYEYPRGTKQLPIGNTLCYRKTLWASQPFPEIAIGEDTRFVWSCGTRRSVLTSDHNFYVGVIHQSNTSRKLLTGSCWRPYETHEIHQLLAEDLDFYIKE